MYCDDKVYPDLGESVHHGEGVLHPVGEENVPDVALLRLARALVVVHHAGVVVHVAIPGQNIISSAVNDPSVSQLVFTITEKAPTKAFCWLKAPTSTFTFKTLLRHYAKQALTHGHRHRDLIIEYQS